MQRKIFSAYRAKVAWIFSTTAYGFFRVFLAQAFLSEYGLNIWIFAIIEISSSIVFGVASSRFVENLVRGEKQHRIKLGLAVLSGYFAPDAYILAASGEYPATLRTIVLTIVFIGAVVSGTSLALRVRTSRTKDPVGSS